MQKQFTSMPWYYAAIIAELVFLNLIWVSYETINFLSYGDLSGARYGLNLESIFGWYAAVLVAAVLVPVVATRLSNRRLLTASIVVAIEIATMVALLNLRF